MKKTVSMLLVLAMVMALSISAFAATLSNVGTDTAQVTGTYKGKEAAGTIYSVDIEWKDMTFTYNAPYDGVWNPSSHEYDNVTEASWEGKGTITITNHSNGQITATPSYTAAEGFSKAGMKFSSDSMVVATADNKEGENGAGKPVTGTITVTPTGELPEGTTNAIIGTITITIS